MEKSIETVTISLSEYNELVKIKKGIESKKNVISFYNGYGGMNIIAQSSKKHFNWLVERFCLGIRFV